MYKSQTKMARAAPQSFKSFQKLPIEIRLKIWEPLATEPRVVEVLTTVFEHKGRDRVTFSTFRPVPAILHVNRESRALGHKYYSLYFSSASDMIHGKKNTIYLNPRIDTVFFLSSSTAEAMHLSSVAHIDESHARIRIQKLAIPQGYLTFKDNKYYLLPQLSDFLKLKEIIIVVDQIVKENLDNDEDDYLIQSDESPMPALKPVGRHGKALIFQNLPEDGISYPKNAID